MIDLQNAQLLQISIHKSSPEPSQAVLTSQPVELNDDNIKENLTGLLIKNFVLDAPYRFSENEINRSGNSYSSIKSLFREESKFHDITIKLAEGYMENSSPKPIKPGELVFCEFDNILSEGIPVKGLAIFKLEGRDNFLELKGDNRSYSISIKQGVSLNRQNQAVLIIDKDPDSGFLLFFRKADLGLFRNHFMDEFLKVYPVRNSFYHTSNHMNLLKTYLEDEMEEEDKIDKIDKLNRSVEFMKNNEKVNLKEFESDIFEKSEQIDAFENFRKNYARDHELEIVDEFEISAPAVNQNKRYIRSVLKLDKNFHVYVHGSRHNIERGYDPERKMNYYTLYFNDES